MKLVLSLLGVVLLVVAAVYFLMPADQATELHARPRGWRDAHSLQAWHCRWCRRHRAAGGGLVDWKKVREHWPGCEV